MIDKTPRVFISYSWTSTEYQERVIQLATKLRQNGVDVRLDVWDLKDGQDKYVFMEQCVTDPEIDKVLILSDKRYAEKADERKGGVGDETTIISAEVYGHADQTKIIPVIMERDSKGNAFLPAYLKSRIYRDLSGENFDEEFKELLRTIYEAPSHQKPELGEKPLWLTQETPRQLLEIKDAVEKLRKCSSEKSASISERRFIDLYIHSIKHFFKDSPTNDEYLADFLALKDYRNVFLDHLEPLACFDNFGFLLADAFEKVYNTLFSIRFFIPNAHQCGEKEFDLFKLHVWELFVCSVTFMLHHEMYFELGSLLRHTYFLRISALGEEKRPYSYEHFRYHSWMMEDNIKPLLGDNLKRKYTLTGHYLCNERDYLPVYSGKEIANADLFLYQVHNCLDISSVPSFGFTWFPTCYVYTDMYDSVWKKLISKGFCEKIMPLFGVSSISDFRARIAKSSVDRSVAYPEAWNPAPTILSFIKIEEIATLP